MASSLFIASRGTLADASDLIRCFGEAARRHAAERAEVSRGAGNVRMFCHWRQVERLIGALDSEDVTGTVH